MKQKIKSLAVLLVITLFPVIKTSAQSVDRAFSFDVEFPAKIVMADSIYEFDDNLHESNFLSFPLPTSRAF